MNKPTPRMIDMTPTWQAILPAMLEVLDNPEAKFDSRKAIREELERMAKIADAYVALSKEKKTNSISLIDAIEEIESKDFRTVHDTGGNPCAMLVLNRLRSLAELPAITAKDLPAFSDGKYRMPVGSKLLANRGEGEAV